MATRSVNSRYREHIFYTGLAALLALTVFVGFSRTYYVKGLFGTPRLSWTAHLHGAAFTLWVLFFVLQTALVSTPAGSVCIAASDGSGRRSPAESSH